MGIAQRYARAAGSDDLTNDELHVHPDVLAAVALSSTFGALLFRVKYLNDVASYRRLRDQWTWIVSCKAQLRTWPDRIPVDRIAGLSLDRWLNSTCPACTGRKQEKIFGTPHLSSQSCRVCDGSGEAPLRVDQRWRDYVLDMVEELTADEHKAAARARKKLGK